MQPKLKLVSSQPPGALLARRVTELNDAWSTLVTFPCLPQSWFGWLSALDRLEGERIRYLKQRER